MLPPANKRCDGLEILFDRYARLSLELPLASVRDRASEKLFVVLFFTYQEVLSFNDGSKARLSIGCSNCAASGASTWRSYLGAQSILCVHTRAHTERFILWRDGPGREIGAQLNRRSTVEGLEKLPESQRGHALNCFLLRRIGLAVNQPGNEPALGKYAAFFVTADWSACLKRVLLAAEGLRENKKGKKNATFKTAAKSTKIQELCCVLGRLGQPAH